MHPNLDTWVKASVAEYFSNGVAGKVYVHVDGAPDKTADKVEWIELYVIGPSEYNPSHGYYLHEVEILVGCIVCLDSPDIFALNRIKGLVKSLMVGPIPIKRFGNPADSENDQSDFNCLVLRTDVNRPIDGMDYGIVSHREVEVRRSTVEGRYKMD